MGGNEKIRNYEGVVVGAGPGGLASLASLSDAGSRNILWVDKTFEGGRLNESYREIWSNTKTGIYLDTIYSSPTCRSIIESASAPNAVTRLKSLDRDSTCQSSFAGDMICMSRDGSSDRPEVKKMVGEVVEARLEASPFRPSANFAQRHQGHIWTVQVDSIQITTQRVFLCTGSHPKTASLHRPFNSDSTVLDVDECMRRSHLPSSFPKDSKSIVAVVGNSHSGILCCRNLYEISQSHERDIKVLNFNRRDIRYAEYSDAGIVFDNTGLKGATAEWARKVMEKDPDRNLLEAINMGDAEDSVFRQYLPRCTHIVYAIGYAPSPSPSLYVGGQKIEAELEFDMHSSGFKLKGREERVTGSYGIGIAFPEETKDAAGHIEAAVGIAKFFSFARRVKGDWMESR